MSRVLSKPASQVAECRADSGELKDALHLYPAVEAIAEPSCVPVVSPLLF